MYVCVGFKRSRIVNEVRADNFVITLTAMVFLVVTVSR
jgi:hypothetical protein